jgi:hypothetical protein
MKREALLLYLGERSDNALQRALRSCLARGNGIQFCQLFLTPIGIHNKSVKVSSLDIILFNYSTLFLGAPAGKVSISRTNFLGGYLRGGVGPDNRRENKKHWHIVMCPYIAPVGWTPGGHFPHLLLFMDEFQI